jgi:HSP20 family protein
MSAMTKWNPFREMDELSRRLTNLWGLSPTRTNGGEENVTTADWTPLVDISEDEKEYLIKAELPGVTKDDVRVTVEHGTLRLSGERRFKREEKDDKKKYHRVERFYGSFVRSFTVPEDADATKVHAAFADGMLTVHLPKAEEARPRTVDVKIK